MAEAAVKEMPASAAEERELTDGFHLVIDALKLNGGLLSSRIGVKVAIRKVAVRSLKKNRAAKIPKSLLTENWREIVHDSKIQIVAELVGGTTVAREIVLAALKLGKPVVTANKALISAHGEELFAAAKKGGGQLQRMLNDELRMMKLVSGRFCEQQFPSLPPGEEKQHDDAEMGERDAGQKFQISG